MCPSSALSARSNHSFTLSPRDSIASVSDESDSDESLTSDPLAHDDVVDAAAEVSDDDGVDTTVPASSDDDDIESVSSDDRDASASTGPLTRSAAARARRH